MTTTFRSLCVCRTRTAFYYCNRHTSTINNSSARSSYRGNGAVKCHDSLTILTGSSPLPLALITLTSPSHLSHNSQLAAIDSHRVSRTMIRAPRHSVCRTAKKATALLRSGSCHRCFGVTRLTRGIAAWDPSIGHQDAWWKPAPPKNATYTLFMSPFGQEWSTSLSRVLWNLVYRKLLIK